ncbi:uncharacterized protein LOC112559740 isoform X2 [Pomacea canaliculata]|uniref:uncharacterized protein LOC112559740 isoform X2 n=1 Tax=Pomacea canaliculata TaxID=400727 RepID=UPI000D7325D3|nr:uncharacterized protein LOC112559740 isoform X2 [Pomacea canaliculata]
MPNFSACNIYKTTISNPKKSCLDHRMAEGLFFLAIFIISSETNKWTVASEVDDANYCKLCPTLCFKGHHKDSPCTECTDSEIKNRSFTDHCNHMKTLPWQREIKCDSQSPAYHLPKCQKISLEVKCQNEHLGERYHMACGDVCTILCRDKVVSVVECTKDLEWNDTIPDERQCPQEQEPNSSDVTTIIIGTSVCCIAAVVITCIVLFIKYKRQKSISRGSSTTSDPPERSNKDVDKLLPPGHIPEVICHPPEKVSEFPCWTPLLGGSEAPGVVHHLRQN